MDLVLETIHAIRRGGYLDRAEALERLVRERDGLLVEVVELRSRRRKAQERIEEAGVREAERRWVARQAFVNRARDALLGYGSHKTDCRFEVDGRIVDEGESLNRGPCDCGFDRALGELV